MDSPDERERRDRLGAPAGILEGGWGLCPDACAPGNFGALSLGGTLSCQENRQKLRLPDVLAGLFRRLLRLGDKVALARAHRNPIAVHFHGEPVQRAVALYVADGKLQ